MQSGTAVGEQWSMIVGSLAFEVFDVECSAGIEDVYFT